MNTKTEIETMMDYQTEKSTEAFRQALTAIQKKLSRLQLAAEQLADATDDTMFTANWAQVGDLAKAAHELSTITIQGE